MMIVMYLILLGPNALAWKPVGAGAGGCVIILAREGSESAIQHACENQNWARLFWDYDDIGIKYESE